MATVAEGLQAQIRNIESTYGRSIDEWVELIRASGLRRHGEIVAMLKGEHGLTHGSANRVALVALERIAGTPAPASLEDALYPESRRHLLPLHAALMEQVRALGGDIELAPKKGYVSIRRRKQFAMIQPAAKHIDLGLILPGAPDDERLESAESFNALFSNRVRVRTLHDIDGELIGWLREAYEAAG
ncbi:MAG TPA: DUF4287 domain-containing protein [Candidatus Dormibacteraeota bacterium]|nr:DUF4287 domain-containing protein [Candidatus Dormibacteraeota bacterium]